MDIPTTLNRLYSLCCPVCHARTLTCCVFGYRDAQPLTVELVAQDCGCDPWDAWEEVWEQACAQWLDDEAVA